MDYGLLAGLLGGATGLFSLWRGLSDYNKGQREAGAKEERDKNRDLEIKSLWDKITEMDTVKQEMLKVSYKLEALESSIEKLIVNLDKHIDGGK